MKKLLTILTLLSAFLLTACGPSYDYSSFEKFEKSIKEQAKEENIDKRKAEDIICAYMLTMLLEDVEGSLNTVLACEDEEELAKEIWLFIKKHTDGKTLAEMQENTFPLFQALNEDDWAERKAWEDEDSYESVKNLKTMSSAFEKFGIGFTEGFLGKLESKNKR